MQNFAEMRDIHHTTSTSQELSLFPGNTGDALKPEHNVQWGKYHLCPPSAHQLPLGVPAPYVPYVPTVHTSLELWHITLHPRGLILIASSMGKTRWVGSAPKLVQARRTSPCSVTEPVKGF